MSVYFATSGPYTKIGYSKDPVGRSSTITTNGTRPDDLPRAAAVEIIGWIPGDHRTEIEYHGRFANQRVAGEWFEDIDRDEIEALIWADPRGVNFKRMSAQAIFACLKWPTLTRDQLEACGFIIEAVPVEEAIASIDAKFSEALSNRRSA